MKSKLEPGKLKLGLVLSGGGAKGFAHPGAIRAIEDCGLKPDVICGTSAGALAAVFYADGYAPEEIIDLFAGREFKEFAELQVPRVGIFRMTGFQRFLKRNLRAKKFEDLRIPVKVVATDLDDGVSVVFDKGPMIEPIMASCSIPIIFSPIIINGVNYVDGGLFKNFPATNIRSICEKLIGVNVSPLVPKRYNRSLLHIAERSYHYMFRANTLLDRKLCDVLIEPDDISYYKTFDLENSMKIFQSGYQAAQKSLLESVSQNVFTVLCTTEDGKGKVLLP